MRRTGTFHEVLKATRLEKKWQKRKSKRRRQRKSQKYANFADMYRKIGYMESHPKGGSSLRDVILGGQDGLVNVLGIVLAVATATSSTKVVLIAALAATLAESISMAAVAYTSSKAARDYYYKQLEIEKQEIEEKPEVEVQEIRDIYHQKGFRGTLLNSIVKKITSNKKLWLDTMMKEELRLFPDDYDNPVKSALVVGFAALIGSIIPIVPFFFLPVGVSMIYSIVISAITLFIAGIIKARITVGNPIKAGFEMMLVGILAALAGYLIGLLLARFTHN